jgi:hypothetical protein
MAKVFTEELEIIIKLLEYDEKLQNNINITTDLSIIIGINIYIKKYPDKLFKIYNVLNKHKDFIIKTWKFPNKELIIDYLAISSDKSNFMDYLISLYDYTYNTYNISNLDIKYYINKYSDETIYPNMAPSKDILIKINNNNLIYYIILLM